tara:strand:- start:2209 stop:8574 length:6366 start_codon:yes stop_codon:yes gene_type:complete
MSTRSDILDFLRDPAAFARSTNDGDIWLRGLSDIINPLIEKSGDFPLRPAQEDAWRGLADQRVGLVLGPPGTGKTYLLSKLIVGYVRARQMAGKPARVFVSAFTRNAIGNLLDAVAREVKKLAEADQFPVFFLGNAPNADLDASVKIVPATDEESLVSNALGNGLAVVGATVWGLNRFIGNLDVDTERGQATPLFDLICIDEASQLVLSHGLMALAGLADNGRIVVAGDDKQLPPIRSIRETKIGDRDVGGSLYQFLKSAHVSEFPLEDTFRLNAPLTRFPEQNFYPGKFQSIVEGSDERLKLKADWSRDLSPISKAALDPNFPITVLVHNGPVASTSNAFESALACRFAAELFDRIPENDDVDGFWQHQLAIISPHRAQNALIKRDLAEAIKKNAFVETVDRIQGKERKAVILTYCVSDVEFALMESEFIFSKERLNVATTRAKSKLILIVSRQLLSALPADQDVLDQAELLREFVYGCSHQANVEVPQLGGSSVRVEIRTRGFDGEAHTVDTTDELDAIDDTPEEALPPQLEDVLRAIKAGADPRYSSKVKMWVIKKAIKRDPFPDCVRLHHLGWINLEHRPEKDANNQWQAFAYEQQKRLFPCTEAVVRIRIKRVIQETPKRFYNVIRERFAWMDETGADLFRPIIETLAAEGLVSFKHASGHELLELGQIGDTDVATDTVYEPHDELPDGDFALLNLLEDLEAEHINFGIYEAWTSIVELSRKANLSLTDATETVSRLEKHGFLISAPEGRLRSRFAELAREVRLVKQRFSSDDADTQPFLVRGLKVEVIDRQKPTRNVSLRETITSLGPDLPEAYQQGLEIVFDAFSNLWKSDDPRLAGFQTRSLTNGLRAWAGIEHQPLAIAAQTGSGKTEAAILPMIAGALGDKLLGRQGVKAILAYPRIRLVANQAQRLAYYLSACSQVEGAPALTLGMQTGDVPKHFDLNDQNFKNYHADTWEQDGAKGLKFPFFDCPVTTCDHSLHLKPGQGQDGADLLHCTQCGWKFRGWVGSKNGLCTTPPDFFLPTTDSLHQWLHTPAYGILFGDDPKFAAPRAILADEIHLYTHIHGAQVGMMLRRLVGRCESNARNGEKVLAIGMSATIGDPAKAWGRLIGHENVLVIQPETDELDHNPRGREYFYFVQPEIESRERDIAGASTTIQSLMCLAHGMRRRTQADGGYRSLVFFDSLDKMRRLHSAYIDAEDTRNLASLRTVNFGDDLSGNPLEKCCGNPLACDQFTDGECWWFAANDPQQWGADGYRQVGTSLKVARQTVSSKATGRVEDLIRKSDIVFTTSSLEVGYDDPDISLVYQHYSPLNLASFVQRKGRGGRGTDDRPITGVTLSMYSPRDRWWFQNPKAMISPSGFETPLNPDNFFVLRGQVLCAILDGLSRSSRGQNIIGNDGKITLPTLEKAAAFAEGIFGATIWAVLGFDNVADFWVAASSQLSAPLVMSNKVQDMRNAFEWCPKALFDTINLPSVEVKGLNTEQKGAENGVREDVSLFFPTVAPGNASRRFDFSRVYWRPPVDGTAPWFSKRDYDDGIFHAHWTSERDLLDHLPTDSHELLAKVDLRLFRPRAVTLELLGEVSYSDWIGQCDYGPSTAPAVIKASKKYETITHESRSQLRGTLIVTADQDLAHPLSLGDHKSTLSSAVTFVGRGASHSNSGLKVDRVFWAADCELRFSQQGRDPETLVQVFSDPASSKPLLHGYSVETEGVQIRLNVDRLNQFANEVAERLAKDESSRKHYRAQFMRFLIESRATSKGINAYQARRGADLFVSAAADEELRKELEALLKRWGPNQIASLFENTRSKLLAHHPMYSKRRVEKTAEALSDRSVQTFVRESFQEVADQDHLKNYLKSCVLNGLSLRLKQSLALVGQGDDRKMLAHVRLPIQFSGTADAVITICESGAKGDGTIRTVEENWQQVLNHFSNGFLTGCPNADEDALLREFWRKKHKHPDWQQLDPRSNKDLVRIIREIDPAFSAEQVPMRLLRTLFENQEVSGHQISIYSLAEEIEGIRSDMTNEFKRSPSDWEVASRTVAAATENPDSALGELLRAYRSIDGIDQESLSPEARLADQVHRLAAPLCSDGCRACVHQPSDMMSDSMVEASVSRQLLSEFIGAS